MPSIKILKLDGGEKEVTTLENGEHVFGRETFLECDDKRVSRKHGIIRITDEGNTITPIHINPCFYIPAEGKVITILPKDKPTTLRDGDRFALLPDQFWFKVKVCNEMDNDRSMFTLVNGICKMLETEETDAIENRIFETSIEAENVEIKEENDVEVSEEKPNVDCIESVNGKKEEKPDVSTVPTDIKTEIKSEGEGDKSNINTAGVSGVKTEMKPECDSRDDQTVPTNTAKEVLSDEENYQNAKKVLDNNASGSSNQLPQKRKWRDRCWYGQSCYRKNVDHTKAYSHPGDSDFESDPDDNRPSCSYGTACYRRNSTHRRDYKHPSGTNGAPPLKKRRQPKKVNSAAPMKQKKQSADDDLEDEYDLEDPFIDDGSEDEYQPDNVSDESDSEWNDSQGVDEDEDTKRLVKEAKRFTRDSKKD